jgi:hypothetical protein
MSEMGCQKAFGGVFGALVAVRDLEWTRGAPRTFQSRLPKRPPGSEPTPAVLNASIVSDPHPDHGTVEWPPRGGF